MKKRRKKPGKRRKIFSIMVALQANAFLKREEVIDMFIPVIPI
jgi:hypothetical protein